MLGIVLPQLRLAAGYIGWFFFLGSPVPSIPRKRAAGSHTYCPTLGKHLLITVFHFDVAKPDPLCDLFDAEKVSYWIYQHEKAGTTGRDHLQLYMVCLKRFTLKQVQAMIGDPTAHIEPRHGTIAEAIAYCSKEDTRAAGPWEKGSKPTDTGQGKRTDLLEAMTAIKGGMSEVDFCEKYPSLAFHAQSGIQRLYKLFAPMRSVDVPMVVDLYCGPTHTGKSWDAFHQLQEEYHTEPFIKPTNCQWFDMYRNQKGVVFDEYTGNTFMFHNLLQLTDRYPTAIQFKGGSMPWMAEHIIITSNKPGTWYTKLTDIERDAMFRRFRKVVIYRAIGDHYEILNMGPGREREFRDTVLAKWKEFGMSPADQGAIGVTPGCPE